MVNAISIKTKLGWVSAYENNGKIFKIRFGKIRKQIPSNVLNKLKKNFTKNVIPNKKLPFIVRGNKTQKKVWSELRKIKSGQTKTPSKCPPCCVSPTNIFWCIAYKVS